MAQPDENQFASVKHFETGKGTIYLTTTDYGADCDDQKAALQLIAQLRPGDEVFVMAGGPQPAEAAKAIAQAVRAKTGKYPFTAEATQFEAHKTPKEKIFSLVNGEPICNQELPGFSTVTRNNWQLEIDKALKSDQFSQLELNVISPLLAENEFYNAEARANSDPDLAASLKKIPKSANIQMPRKDGKFDAATYNYSNSTDGLPEKFHDSAMRLGFDLNYIDGATAKDKAFKISALQPNLGVKNAIGFYIESKQGPWANMPGPAGTVPQREQMHVTMLTEGAVFPYIMHMSGRDFGRERLARETCIIEDATSADYASLSQKVEQELDRIDTEVLKSKFGEHCNVAAKRAEMHAAMLSALNTFAADKGVEGKFESFQGFFGAVNKLAAKTNEKPVATPHAFAGEFKTILFRDNPWYKDITNRAEKLWSEPGPDGKSPASRLAAIIMDSNAQSVPYDAVTIAAGRTIAKDPELAAHFTEQDRVRVVNPNKIASLRESNNALYEKFVNGVRAEMTHDGTVMAYSDRELGLVVPTKFVPAENRTAQFAADRSVSRLGSSVTSVPKETLKRSYSESDVTAENLKPPKRSSSFPNAQSMARQLDRPERGRDGRDSLSID